MGMYRGFLEEMAPEIFKTLGPVILLGLNLTVVTWIIWYDLLLHP